MIGAMVARAVREKLVFRAISDPARRTILNRLASQGATPALDLGRGFPASQPAFSKHLRVLRDAGLVRVERAGRQQLYSLDPSPLQMIDTWISPFRRFWEERLDALGRHLENSR